MPNEYIKNNIEEARIQLNQMEENPNAIENANRILDRNKSFLEPKQLEQYDKFNAEKGADAKLKIDEAEQLIKEQYGEGTYLYHINLGNYKARNLMEIIEMKINFFYTMNQKL